MEVVEAFCHLKTYCEAEGYRGWDPYDGLSSAIFQRTPLKYSSMARLITIQACKRSRVNLRPLLRVPKQYNAKGLGLFLSGYCNIYNLAKNGDCRFGTLEEIRKKIDEIAELLLRFQSTGYSGACWGYGFDWQSRAFFLPSNTPTVVATSFVVDALFSAFEITRNSAYLNAAVSAGDFVTKDLNRVLKGGDGFMFSYSPMDRRAVYNATLLGTKILSQIYSYTRDLELKDLACASAKAVCALQNEDGSFPHSDQVGQRWRDSFHTGFKIEALAAYQELCCDDQFRLNIERGFEYWLDSYFEHESGFAYYYDRNQSPTLVDLHCAAQALPTIYKLGKIGEAGSLFDRIAQWPIDNMRSERGYFYFQRTGPYVNRTPYMRWPNAWMFYGLSFWLLKVGYAQN